LPGTHVGAAPRPALCRLTRIHKVGGDRALVTASKDSSPGPSRRIADSSSGQKLIAHAGGRSKGTGEWGGGGDSGLVPTRRPTPRCSQRGQQRRRWAPPSPSRNRWPMKYDTKRTGFRHLASPGPGVRAHRLRLLFIFAGVARWWFFFFFRQQRAGASRTESEDGLRNRDQTIGVIDVARRRCGSATRSPRQGLDFNGTWATFTVADASRELATSRRKSSGATAKERGALSFFNRAAPARNSHHRQPRLCRGRRRSDLGHGDPTRRAVCRPPPSERHGVQGSQTEDHRSQEIPRDASRVFAGGHDSSGRSPAEFHTKSDRRRCHLDSGFLADAPTGCSANRRHQGWRTTAFGNRS